MLLKFDLLFVRVELDLGPLDVECGRLCHFSGLLHVGLWLRHGHQGRLDECARKRLQFGRGSEVGDG